MKPELPRYRLTEAAFLQPARSTGMIPINEAARAAKAAAIRARGVRRPSAGDRTALISLTRSLGGPMGNLDEMAAFIERWLSANPQPEKST